MRNKQGWIAILLCVTGVAAVAKDHMNVVFFLVDDLGWADVSPNRPDTFYETPNVQRLADTGVRFTNAYAACPVCSPTRASILTGQYPTRSGITDYINPGGGNQPQKWGRPTKLLPAPYTDRLPLESVTLAEAMKQQGYATFFAGKWHLGVEGFFPEDQGFDVNKGGLERGGPYGGDKYFSPYGNKRLADGPKGEHLPARLAKETCEFIEANKNQPFLAYLSFYSVHTPLIGRPDLVEKYEARRTETAALAEEERWGDEGLRKVRLVQDHAVYAAMVEAMDLAVGDVLRKLDELNLAENTIVVFFSDNGGLSTSEGFPTSNLPLRGGKGLLYEGGIREPLLMRVPGMTKAGTVNPTPISSVDFFPTLLDLCGLRVQGNDPLDGVSLKPVLKGESLAERSLFWHYPHYGNQGGEPGGVVRRGQYKLIEFYEDQRVELYDLKNDISETNNLASAMPELVGQLRKQLADWCEETGAKMPTPNPRFNAEQMTRYHQNSNRNRRYR